MRIPIAYTIAAAICCTLSFAETPSPAPTEVTWAIKPIDLPAENVELLSNTNPPKKIVVAVLKRDANGVTVRTPEGKEVFIAWYKLANESVTKLKGVPIAAPKTVVANPRSLQGVRAAALAKAQERFARVAAAKPTTAREEAIQKLTAEVAPLTTQYYTTLIEGNYPNLQEFKWWEETRTMAPKDVMDQLSDPASPLHVKIPIKRESLDFKIAGIQSNPNWAEFNTTPWDAIANGIPEVKDEVVSLRPKFEELGVTATKQIGESCGLYSTYHLLQFACKDAGITPPTLDSMKAVAPPTMGGRYNYEALRNKIGVLCKQQPKIQWIYTDGSTDFAPLNYEVAKIELRKGNPVLAELPGHLAVLTGFTTKDGGTTWEYIDSNGVDVDKGFKRAHSAHMKPLYSVSFQLNPATVEKNQQDNSSTTR